MQLNPLKLHALSSRFEPYGRNTLGTPPQGNADYAQSLNPVLHSIAEYKNSQSSVNQEVNKEDSEAGLDKELFAKLCISLLH